jgi:hypothetical protein
MAKPGTASIYVVGAALLGVFALAAWGVLGASSGGGTEKKLVLAAKRCGFEDPRFKLHDSAWELNETEVTGLPYGPLTGQQKRNWERFELVRTKWMPCLQQQAKAMGVRVTYEKMVIVN